MDYPPPRQTRSYQYNNSSQGYSRSRSIDNRAKQHNHREQEQLEYDDSTPVGFNMEDIYEEQQKNEGPNKNLEDRISNSMPDQDYNGDASPGANEDIDQNESNSTTGNQRILGSSKEDVQSTLNNEMAGDNQKSGYLGLNTNQNGGMSRGSADKETSPTTSKDSSAASKDVDPNELRQKVLESLAEKKKKAAVFMNQEKEGTGKLDPSPEIKTVSAASNGDHASSVENSQRKGSASNPERDAAVNALLAEAMCSVKPSSGKSDTTSAEPSKAGLRSPIEDSFDPARRKKHYPDDLKLATKSTGNEHHKNASPRTGPDHDPDSSRRSSFGGQYFPSNRNEKQYRGRNASREDYKEGHGGSFSRTPTSATRSEFSRGPRYEHEERDRRDGSRQDVRHRYEDPPLSAKELRHPGEKISPSDREGRRSDSDHRGHYAEEEEKVRGRRDDQLYKIPEAPRDESRDPYSRALRHQTAWHGQDLGIEASYLARPPGHYLPPRDDPRVIRPPETDYAALYYRDLAEWLDITGYHDFHHRQMILVRHRDNRALEERRLAIEDDPEASRGYIARSQTIAPRDDDIRRVRASSAYAMPPPSGIPSRDERELSVRAHEGVPLRAPSRAAMYPPILRDERPRYADEFRASPPGDAGGLKRRISFREDDYEDQSRPTGKSARLSYEASHRTPQSEEYINNEAFGAHNKGFSSARSGHTEPADNRHPSRRIKEERFEDTEDEASAVRQSLSKRIAASRGREASPPALLESRIRKPSPPRRVYENDSRKEGFVKRDHEDSATGQPNKFHREDGRPQRKTFDKEHRTPEQSPRFQKEFQKPGRAASGKFVPRDEFRKPFQPRRFSDESHPGGNIGRRPSFEDFKKKPYGRGRGRGGGGFHKEFHPSTRHENKEFYADTMDVDRRPEHTIDTRGNDTRYFVVKSFNHDNVTMAQKDELWATQKKNSEIFDEAFKTSRDVILVFSVNKSGKFQGYARMESAPGTASIPIWAKNLLWESSGPFRIRWITICDISFHRVAHLTNRLNEDQPVLIGRDGQEIDTDCGAALCKLIDESAAFRRSYTDNGAGN